MSKQKAFLPIAALALASILWGANTVFIKMGVASIPVPFFMAIRFLIASALLLPLALRGWKPLAARDFLLLSLASVFYISLSALALNVGLTKTSAIDASVIYLLEPIILLVLSTSFLKEKLDARTFIGICVALAGSFIIIGKPWAGTSSSSELTGNLLIVIAAFCFAISVLICKPITKRVRVEQLTFMSLFPGTLPVAIYALTQSHGWNPAATTSRSWLGLIASIVAVTFANLLFFFALNHKKALETAVYEYLEAISTIIVAWILLAERPTANFILGTALVFAGVYVAELYKLRKASPS